jgi:hypothetical protein
METNLVMPYTYLPPHFPFDAVTHNGIRTAWNMIKDSYPRLILEECTVYAKNPVTRRKKAVLTFTVYSLNVGLTREDAARRSGCEIALVAEFAYDDQTTNVRHAQRFFSGLLEATRHLGNNPTN